jgi:hypothetical protein
MENQEKMEKRQCIIVTLEPNERIIKTVLVRIHVIEKRRATAKIAVSSLCSFGAIVLTVFLVGDIAKEMQTSGFIEYAGLLFSDSGSVVSNFREFSLVLVESLPEVSTAFILAAIVVLLVSLRSFSRNLPYIRSSVHRDSLTVA